ALRAAGLRVPDDVAIVGFDDSSVAQSTDPQLTTVRQPMYAQGEAMAGVLLSRLAGRDPEHLTILPTGLVVRESA
ncbi:substrate-binding domain-containing protein, partial [Pseudomonas sp. BGM005]|nr:substrate-binding domain-containing protein [Pseudomonas sp. BG5]